MNSAAPLSTSLPAAVAFDRLAESYDAKFTDSVVGRLQRQIVWDALSSAFYRGDFVLELNCGTGEDALFLAKRGLSVLACDASEKMIAIATRRKQREFPGGRLEFRLSPNEALGQLDTAGQRFDGALSNFSGLNCVEDLRSVATTLAGRIKPRGRVFICMSTRACAWEIVWHLARGNFRKAFRRLSGSTVATVEGVRVSVHYPTARQIRRAFAPSFRICSMRAVGLFIPPSYAETWSAGHPRLLSLLALIDRATRSLPGMRQLGDHILIEFERVRA